MSNARDLANRRRLKDLQAVEGFNPKKVRDLAHGLLAQMRMANVTPLEMIGVGDALIVTVATTLLEVAEPGPSREQTRKELTEILDRMRRDLETAPTGSNEVN